MPPAVSSYTSYILSTFVSLAAILALAFAVVYAGRKFGMGRGHGPLRVVGHLPLDARRSIYLVHVGRSVLVIGASEAGLVRLGDLSPDEVPESLDPKVSFSDVMNRVLSKKDDGSTGGAP